MKVGEMISVLEKRVPPEALSCDNVGLLVGDREQQVHKVYVALDATEEVIDHAIRTEADLLVTHHPLIFSGIKKITAEDFLGKRIIKLITHGISYYTMHTNYDVHVMGRLADERMGFVDTRVLEPSCEDEEGMPLGIGTLARLPRPVSLEELAVSVREAFGLSHVKVFGDPKCEISVAAMVPGSGKSEIPLALASGAQVLITGDVDHHSGIDAVAQNLAVIDAGHYGMEHIFIEDTAAFIERELPELTVEREPFEEPFRYI